MRTDYSDDEEQDIADDPLQSAINADIERVSRETDNRLLFAILAIAASLYFVNRYWREAPLLGVLSAIGVVVAIAFTIRSSLRAKAAIADKYGLTCTKCKHRPSAQMIPSAAVTLQCGKCGAKLILSDAGMSPNKAESV